MATATIPLAIVRERKASIAIREFEVPSYALRAVATPAEMPKDELGREIVTLFAEHPELESQFSQDHLNAMPQASKLDRLADIKKFLGIKPIRTRRLGFAGFD